MQLITVIIGQATIILVACSLLLTLVKDLFETRIVSSGLPEKKKKIFVPGLTGHSANYLRHFMRIFGIGLPTFYIAVGLGALIVERSAFGDENMRYADYKLSLPAIFSDAPLYWRIRFKLVDVYTFELFGHFIIVVIVALIFFWTVNVRRENYDQRLLESAE